jgi:hypothetical protein
MRQWKPLYVYEYVASAQLFERNREEAYIFNKGRGWLVGNERTSARHSRQQPFTPTARVVWFATTRVPRELSLRT